MGTGKGRGSPVNRAGMASLGDQLWGQVLGSAAQGESLGTGCQPLGKTKVRHLEVAIRVQQQILRLQITA